MYNQYVCMYKNIEFLYLLLAGKSAMANGVGAFTKAASIAYKNISEAEREELVDTLAQSVKQQTSLKDIKKAGSQIFQSTKRCI